MAKKKPKVDLTAIGERLRRLDEKLEPLLGRLEELEKKLARIVITETEVNRLIGELRANRYLLDRKGEYKKLDLEEAKALEQPPA